MTYSPAALVRLSEALVPVPLASFAAVVARSGDAWSTPVRSIRAASMIELSGCWMTKLFAPLVGATRYQNCTKSLLAERVASRPGVIATPA